MHTKNSFLTLTYSPENMPKDGSLNVKHWQLFAKRLRKKIGPFRYFHCGEYGEENGRPHYHACVFGVDFSGDRRIHQIKNENKLYKSKLLEDTWALGFCTIGELTYESAAYVARYIMKKISPGHDDNSKEKYREAYERTDKNGNKYMLTPEYVTMSRNKGIGTTWFQKYKTDIYPEDEVIIAGRRFRPPRFYDDKLEEQELKNIKTKRQIAVRKKGKDLTPERLLVREKVHEQKNKRLERLL